MKLFKQIEVTEIEATEIELIENEIRHTKNCIEIYEGKLEIVKEYLNQLNSLISKMKVSQSPENSKDCGQGMEKKYKWPLENKYFFKHSPLSLLIFKFLEEKNGPVSLHEIYEKCRNEFPGWQDNRVYSNKVMQSLTNNRKYIERIKSKTYRLK